MTQLVKGFTNEELWQKAEYEGIEYLFLNYLDPDHSMFMFHNYSGGTIGKGGEMLDQLQHERAWSEKLLRSVYEDFLTEAEIQSMLNNKDLWMDGIEVMKRLKKKAKTVKKSIDTNQDQDKQ